MPRHILPHKWTHYTRDWVQIEGKPACMVKTSPVANGYLWVHGKQFGFEPILNDALNWAEAAREHYLRLL